MQKRALAVHDISCVGKCSLTVALPILSAAGIETSVLPTAVLSTHTGGFTGYTFHDLTDEITPVTDHWKSLGLHFDAIYTGYLGSFRQLELVGKLFDDFKSDDTLIFVDPVMADGGKLYPAFSADFPTGMKELCRKADIVVPNITEASLLLNVPYTENYDKAYIEDMLRALSKIGPRMAVLSGVSFEKGKIGAAAFDSKTGTFYYYFSDRIDGYYHGTGDIFGSALLSALMNGKTLDIAIRTAVDFTVGAIIRTKNAGTDVRYGVDFEHGLGKLASLID